MIPVHVVVVDFEKNPAQKSGIFISIYFFNNVYLIP